jgi:hypothetical protein
MPEAGLAFNVTEAPVQMIPSLLVVPEVSVKLIVAAGSGLTVMPILFEVAGLLEIQPAKFEVITQVMVSLFASAAFEKVLLLVPTLPPFFFH